MIAWKRSRIVIAAAGAALIFAAPALARQISSESGSGKSKSDLINDGYTCVVVSTGFQECTKAGSKTYWCTGDACEQAPAKKGPKYRPQTAPLGGAKPPLRTQ